MENLEPTKPQNHGPSWTKIIIIFIIAIAFSFKAGMGLGAKGYAFIPKEFKIVNQSEYPKEVDYNLLWEALDVVGKNYIEKPVDQEKVLYGAIRGAVSSAGDQYTSFFDPKEFDAFKTDLKGSFDGIGAEIGKKDGNIVIVAPIDDSPAKKAGLRAKDIIVAVNGELATDWTTEQTLRKN
jgi:carboxyl-terminal processing protease